MKKRHLKTVIFIVIAYGVPWLSSLGIRNDNIATAFLSCMAVFPSLGVIIGELVVDKKKVNAFHICFFLSGLLMLLCIGMHWNGFKAEVMEQVVGNLFTVLSLVLLLYCSLYEKGKLYPLGGGKKLFLLLGGSMLFLIITLVVMERNESMEYYSSLMMIIPSLCFYIMPYLGEEYAWRGTLQPAFQKKFGKRRGVLLLGVVWELWHACLWIPVFHFDKCGMSIVKAESIRMAVVIALGIMLGWLYMKVQNVWLCAMVHGLYNYCQCGDGLKCSASTTSHIGWIVFGVLCFCLLLTKEFRVEKYTESIQIERMKAFEENS
ncbi:MAG: CPBP family intramembrane metalloprotease [Lachnospiraceae bacterium]|jgi:membrane protease YdiL (CAAX protease family)|nr:CPBP family intramembrane metalloprotease [Lachnospiraceae bacterium]